MRWSWDNTTLACRTPQQAGGQDLAVPPAGTAAIANQSAPTAIAGNADELLRLLATPGVSRILLGGTPRLAGAAICCCSPAVPRAALC